jgi:hypothetical protein
MRRALTIPTTRLAPLDWATLGTLLVLVLVSAYGLAAADWSDHLGMVPTTAVLGVIAGTALARSRFPGWLAALFAVSYGLFLVTFLAASTIVDVFGIHDRLFALGGRLSAFAEVLATAEPNYDPLMFVADDGGLLEHGGPRRLLHLPPEPHLAGVDPARHRLAG